MKTTFLASGLTLLFGLQQLAAQDTALRVERFQSSPTLAGTPWNAFDSDPSTVWEAKPSPVGLGVTLQIAFSETQWVEAVELSLPAGSDVRRMELVLDNQRVLEIGPETRVAVQAHVRSMAWRVIEEEYQVTQTAYNGAGFTDLIHKIDTQRLLIEDITLFGKDENGKQTGLKLGLAPTVEGRLFASSVEEPATQFHPGFLFDGRHDFGWSTDHGKQGVGESMALGFFKQVRIERVRIIDGKAHADGHAPIQVKRLSIRQGDGTTVQLHFDKERKWDGSFLDMTAGKPGMDFGSPAFVPGKWKESQSFDALLGSAFVVTVNEVYPGSSDKVLHLQEMQFFDGKEWFGLAMDMETYQVDFVRAKTKGMAIGHVLDQAITFSQRPIDDDLTGQAQGQTTICFRADGNVLLRSDQVPGQAGDWNFDGAWEHLAPENGVSRVKVTGTLFPIGQNAPGAKPLAIDEIIRIDSSRIWNTRLLGNAIRYVDENTLVPCQSLQDVGVDLRYKTADNFMHKELYPPCMPCLMRMKTADALKAVRFHLDQASPETPYKLLIWDAYRPYSVQKEMWAQVPDSNYVANPYTGGSSHNKGTAIDLTLSIDGINSIDMGTPFDFFGKEAHHGYKKLPKEVRKNRALLRSAMESAGFEALETEWWHYRLPGTYDIIDLQIDCK